MAIPKVGWFAQCTDTEMNAFNKDKAGNTNQINN